jgi:hypothetical protein
MASQNTRYSKLIRAAHRSMATVIPFNKFINIRQLDPSWLPYLPLVPLVDIHNQKQLPEIEINPQFQVPPYQQPLLVPQIQCPSHQGRPQRVRKPTMKSAANPKTNSNTLLDITEQTSKMSLEKGCDSRISPTNSVKRSTVKSMRRPKHYTPYSSYQEPFFVTPSQLTMSSVLKETKARSSKTKKNVKNGDEVCDGYHR